MVYFAGDRVIAARPNRAFDAWDFQPATVLEVLAVGDRLSYEVEFGDGLIRVDAEAKLVAEEPEA